MIDLHTHSTFSDGSLSPEALATLAAEAKLSAVALTDHDTTDGVPRFLKACEGVGIEGVVGVEISVDFSPGTMHMLGFFMDIQNVALQSALQNIRDGRETRNRQILKKLYSLGMELNWDEVAALAGSDVIGRPHIVQALIARGYVKTKDEAFDNLLGKGKSAYVDRFRLSVREGIDCIRNAGGVPVLAHPFTLGLKFGKLRKCVGELAGYGLQGIEVFYSMHNDTLRSQYMSLVEEFSLVATGGSDFHGDMNPSIQIGRGFGNVKVDDSVLVKLRKRIA
jgi:predicted metal-dependent phosphoesterase TrpH